MSWTQIWVDGYKDPGVACFKVRVKLKVDLKISYATKAQIINSCSIDAPHRYFIRGASVEHGPSISGWDPFCPW